MTGMRWTLAAATAFVLVAAANAGELGMKAPKLNVKEWIKGSATDPAAADGKVYVVEFWATWCPPCRESIPHLTEMQKRFGDKVVFIGVSDEDPGTVKPFVEKQGDKMSYVVACDDERKTSAAYMKEFGIQGIPHAFVVDQKGQIIWHDHPMAELDEVIEKVVAGKFDLSAAQAKMAQREESEKSLREFQKLAGEYFQIVASAGKEKEAGELGEKLMELAKGNPGAMNALAWSILTREGLVYRDKNLALKAAEAAQTATKGEDPAILDTYALALYENGQKQKAIEVETKAIELVKKQGGDEEMLKEFEKALEKFKQ